MPDHVATVYDRVENATECRRRMYDRRDNRFVERDAWCFFTTYTDDLTKTVEIKVNRTDFPQLSQAQAHAEFYALHVGKLPKLLRRDVDEVIIHDGPEAFGGGNRGLLIHV